MVGGNHVNGAVCQTCNECLTVLLRAQRRIHAGVDAVGQHVILCQCQMVRGCLGVHICTARLAGANQRNGFGGADVLERNARARHQGELDVAGNHFFLRGRHRAEYIEFLCGFAAVVDAGRQDIRRIFLVERQRNAQCLGAAHGL